MLICDPQSFSVWEDYQAGMYSRSESQEENVTKSYSLLSNAAMFASHAFRTVAHWPISACAHLCDPGRGRRAWVGQATCCFSHGATVAETCQAWAQLTLAQRLEANATALLVILAWEAEQRDQLTLGF